jgi:hypothetical protein
MFRFRQDGPTAAVTRAVGALGKLRQRPLHVHQLRLHLVVSGNLLHPVDRHARALAHPLTERDPTRVLGRGRHPRQLRLESGSLVLEHRRDAIHRTIIANWRPMAAARQFEQRTSDGHRNKASQLRCDAILLTVPSGDVPPFDEKNAAEHSDDGVDGQRDCGYRQHPSRRCNTQGQSRLARQEPVPLA